MMVMEKEPRKLFLRTKPLLILLLVLPLFYFDFSWTNVIHLDRTLTGKQYIFSSEITLRNRISASNKVIEEKQETSISQLSKLVKGEDKRKLEETGFACTGNVDSIYCVASGLVKIDTRTMTVSVPTNSLSQDIVIRPYARQEDLNLLKSVTPVKISYGNDTPALDCQYTHQIPVVVFSSSGFVGNVFHEMNEIIIPLFITTRHFKSRVQFIMEDYNPRFVKKYENILFRLTDHEIINPVKNHSVRCFSGAIVGLKFHGFLAINSSEPPHRLSMLDFKQFLRQSFHLKYRHISQIKMPKVMLLSRRTTRRIINEDEIVSVMKEVGFEVIVVARARVISNITVFAKLINSCSVFVGVHGAGMTNELFLPEGAVIVQVDLIGLEWAAETYYGNPAPAMGLHYLRYKIEPEESSLMRIFGRKDHIALTSPKGAFPVQVGKEVYLNGQNAKIDVVKFRQTMVEAMSIVTDSAI